MKKNYLLLSALIIFALQGYSQCGIKKGNGSDGVFNTFGDTILSGNTYNFTSFTISAGHTVSFSDTVPITIYSQNGVTISGILDVSGQNGGNGNNGVAPGLGGLAGPGGYDGGIGGGGFHMPYNPDNGEGPGGGIGGVTIDINAGIGGGGGGFGTMGDSALFAYDTITFGSGYGIGGSVYGDSILTVMQGGSGGGGGGGDDDGGSSGDDSGGGGGGGGGAIMISADSIHIDSTGQIMSDGGDGGSAGNGGSGGGGSGGAINLIANTFVNNGSVSAIGGGSLINQYTTSEGGTGGFGRVVVKTDAFSGIGTINPVHVQLTITACPPSSNSIPILMNNNFAIYPNPTKGFISVKSTTELINTIKVIDMQGKEQVRFENINSNEKQIDISTLPNGVYFVKLTLVDGNQSVTRIVKM